jgi:hypothetical protein
MIPYNPTVTPQQPFTPDEMRILSDLRRRYLQDRDLFSRPEMARLTFLHWLHRQGRLCP